MSELYVLTSALKDYEFLGFKFNGHHSSEYNLTVVAPSSFSQENLFADFEDTVVSVSGRDGSYYFGTKINTRSFSLTLAFDNLTSTKKKSVLNWLSPKTTSQIIFDESPYKYYWVKVSTPPTFSFVPFEEDITDGKQHVFKGTINVTFQAVDPFAYSDYALLEDVQIWNGTAFTQYSDYPTNTVHFYDATHLPGWYGQSGLVNDLTPSGDEEIAVCNDADGWSDSSITAGDFGYNFYNGGEIESPMEFTMTIHHFATGNSWKLKNTTPTPDEIFELQSLNYISDLATDDGDWTITCNPAKGLITGKTSTTTDGLNLITFNLNALHNGVFLKAWPGENLLNSDRTITDANIKFKYKYW